MILSSLFYIYLVIGLIFSIFFLLIGFKRMDSIGNSSSVLTKVFWLPGFIFLWPLLLTKYITSKGNAEQTEH